MTSVRGTEGGTSEKIFQMPLETSNLGLHLKEDANSLLYNEITFVIFYMLFINIMFF